MYYKIYCLEEPLFLQSYWRNEHHEMPHGIPLMESRRPLSERLKTRAAGLEPDRATATICRIIEARSVIAEQRLRGLSWAALTRLLEEEGVNLSEGTLRNYARMIGTAEAALRAKGNPEPTDKEIHAALYSPRNAAVAAPPRMKTLPNKPSPAAPAFFGDQQSTPPRPDLAPPSARSSVIRNPDRDL